MSIYLAIDIGASSGRGIVASTDDKLNLDEVNRFTMEMDEVDGKKRLNIKKLLSDIDETIKVSIEKYPNLKSIGIDTWAVDTVALDVNNNLVSDPMFYRDESFINELNDYQKNNSLKELYLQTGIQIQPFNTYFQLNKLDENYGLDKVDSLLMLPDFLNFYLCGIKNTEFTNLTSTQCIDIINGGLLNENSKLLPKTHASRILGNLKNEFSEGKDIKVVSVASHDTASAHIAIPNISKKTAFLSSGTWSLLGVEVDKPVATELSYKYNFTNEGCYGGNYRFQKNIMGLWMVVNLAKEINISDFAYLADMASKATCDTIIDVNDQVFFAPKSMKEAILNYIKDNNLDMPKTDFDIARVVYRSLSHSYIKTISEIEECLGYEIEELIIVGGGAKAKFMNEEVNRLTTKTIKTFPYECSALGNIVVQAIELNEFKNIKEAHTYVASQLKVFTIGE